MYLFYIIIYNYDPKITLNYTERIFVKFCNKKLYSSESETMKSSLSQSKIHFFLPSNQMFLYHLINQGNEKIKYIQ